MEVIDSTVKANFATSVGGGIYANSGPVAITTSAIRGNVAGSSGGGIYNAGWGAPDTAMTIDGSTITGNTAAGSSSSTGGGIANFGVLSFVGAVTTIGANTATSTGGGVYQAWWTTSAIAGGCQVADGGKVLYEPQNSPNDYVGFACGS